MQSPKARTLRNSALLAIAAFAISACEFRRDGAEDDAAPDPVETQEALAEPEPTETATATASIIRDENAPENDIELPPEPVELTIPFPDDGEMSAQAERMLAGIMDERALEQDWPVVLGGHTDSDGNDDANMRASRARAEAVAAWLIERGVDDDRIEVIAFGEQNPAAPNALPDGSPNEEGRRTNRRVELRIAPPPSEEEEEVEERRSGFPSPSRQSSRPRSTSQSGSQ